MGAIEQAFNEFMTKNRMKGNKNFINHTVSDIKCIPMKSPADCWSNEEFNKLISIPINHNLYNDIKTLQKIGWEQWVKKAKNII